MLQEVPRLFEVLDILLLGGSKAIILVLLFIISFLIYERRQIFAKLEKQDEKLKDILKEINNSISESNETLEDLKMLLVEIKAKVESKR